MLYIILFMSYVNMVKGTLSSSTGKKTGSEMLSNNLPVVM